MNARSSFLSTTLLSTGLILGLGACAGTADSGEERVYDSRSQELVSAADETVADIAHPVFVSVESLTANASQRMASYTVETRNGSRFRTTVTHRIQRDGADEVITAEDLETGEVVSWTFGAESAVYTGANGSSLSATGDDETETVTFHSTFGPQTLNLSGIAEDSPEEEEINVALAILVASEAGYTQAQVEALSAALEASEADLGGSSMGIWGKIKKGLKKVGKAIGDAMCTNTAMTVCDTMYEGGFACIGFAGMISGAVVTAPVATGIAATCLGIMVVGGACSIGQHFGCD